MPQVGGVLETSLYVEDLPRAIGFYNGLFGFERLFHDARLCALNVAGRHVLLLFKTGASREPMPTPGGVLPPHDGKGELHLAFAVAADELPEWERRLAEYGVAVESTIRWERGGRSVYFRDPDRNLVELVTPGTWAIY